MNGPKNKKKLSLQTNLFLFSDKFPAALEAKVSMSEPKFRIFRL